MSKFSSHSTLVMERIARIPGGCLEGEVGQLRIEKEFLEWQKSSPPSLCHVCYLPRLGFAGGVTDMSGCGCGVTHT